MRDGLVEWGQRCVGDLQEMGTFTVSGMMYGPYLCHIGDDAEAHPASVTHYNAWGERIDKINTYVSRIGVFFFLSDLIESNILHIVPNNDLFYFSVLGVIEE